MQSKKEKHTCKALLNKELLLNLWRIAKYLCELIKKTLIWSLIYLNKHIFVNIKIIQFQI